MRSELLDEMDNEFLVMKPAAMAALRRGLVDRDTNTALRASEMWMKTSGFMQYGKGSQQGTLSAEDVAKQLLQVNVQVNVAKE